MLFYGCHSSFYAASYFAAPARAGGSPSLLAGEAAKVRTLADACVADLPTEPGADPWRWAEGIEKLHRASARDDGARRVLRDARRFLVHLVINGVIPPAGAGLAALVSVTRAKSRAGGNRQVTSLLAHLAPKDGTTSLILHAAARAEARR